MKLRFFIGIFIAIFIGLSVGYVFKVGILKSYIAIQNYLEEKYHTAKNLGGPAIEEIKNTLENFPGNEYFQEAPQNFTQKDFEIPESGKAILANLDSMKLYTYENGMIVKEYEILSKGRQGTAWETPPGRFEILYKTENHFSSIGSVWMPYSMQFFGNYFIHGWPYYSDGTPVSEGYSGGCIRMNTGEMAEIYEFADTKTPVIVKGSLLAEQKEIKQGKYDIKNLSKFPKISAQSYVVADIDTGEVIASKAEEKIHPIASLSKLMTALVSLETLNQYKNIMVSDKAIATYGNAGNLSSGEIYTIGDLLYPLMLESSNDAAETIAEYQGRNFFISNMNKKAYSMGLENTEFEDPSGLSKNNKSTAIDLFKLTQYIYKYKDFIIEITKLKEKEIEDKIWYSNSRFRNDENYLGGKNGFTDEAQHTLISIFELPLGEGELEKRNIAIVLLQGKETEKDTRAIQKFLLENVYFKTDEQEEVTKR